VKKHLSSLGADLTLVQEKNRKHWERTSTQRNPPHKDPEHLDRDREREEGRGKTQTPVKKPNNNNREETQQEQ
jgi:hypothetical protein